MVTTSVAQRQGGSEGPTIAQRCDSRLKGLYNERISWWAHWKTIADYMLPRRYKWLVQVNQANRGSPINQYIIDSTGTIAARTLAAGMSAGITSPMRPWFRLRIGLTGADETNSVSLWLAECERRMMRVFSESNFYTAMGVFYQDLVCFGTSCLIVYEDFDDVVRCFNPCLGEFYFANDSKNRVGTAGREFVMSVDAIVKEYGRENCPPAITNLYDNYNDRSALTQEFMIGHLIESNDPPDYGVPALFRWRECYWVRGHMDKPLRCRGFHRKPFMGGRWELVANDPYGRGPGMDALPDIKQLQQEQKRKAQAIDKMVNPPMIADVQLKNQPASMLPGGVTYVTAVANGVGFKPAYEVNPPLMDMKEDIKEVQERIRTIFHNDLFMMISQLQTVRSATEIDARREEKLVMLGPVLERMENEVLQDIIERVFDIMARVGILPPPPPDLQGGQNIEVAFVNMLAEAQSAAETAAIERVFAQTGQLAAVYPDVLDAVDFDAGLAQYAADLRVPPKIMRDKEAIAQMRQQRAQAQQQQQMMEQTMPAVKGAQVLANTQVGGGQSALEAMLQGSAGQ